MTDPLEKAVELAARKGALARAVAAERERCIQSIWQCIGLTEDEKNIAVNAVLRDDEQAGSK